MSIQTKDPSAVKKELLKKLPPKVARKRSQHIIVREPEGANEIAANVRTIPGIISQRGCCYAGARGVVIGPTRDILHLTHGPIGCGFYSWLTRRNQTKPEKADDPNFLPYCYSTDMQEDEIIFGGEKKLKQAIQEAYDLCKPKSISIYATCPVGLIGDDIHAVAKQMSEQLGINVFAVSCEGYKGVSQSAGHHIANNQVFQRIVGTKDKDLEGKYKINLLGEYNIGGDSFLIEDLFKRCGLTLVSTFSGNSTYDDMAQSHTADLNLVMCHRSINYMSEMMEKKFGIPWIKINFIGAQATAKSLRKIASYFGDQALIDRVEAVIGEEMQAVKAAQDEVGPRLGGKLAMLFVGGSRAHHYQELFKEVGMKVMGAGYEFAHRDDYEGREVLPSVKVDADSRNIEELEVTPDPQRFKPRLSPEDIKALEAKNIKLKDYKGMIPTMDYNSLVIDDINHLEQELLLEIYQPAIFCAGIKEKYTVQKNGIPCKQLHSYDYGGPYAAFKGAVNFYYEIDRLVNTKIWSYLRAPWEEQPQLVATFVA